MIAEGEKIVTVHLFSLLLEHIRYAAAPGEEVQDGVEIKVFQAIPDEGEQTVFASHESGAWKVFK